MHKAGVMVALLGAAMLLSGCAPDGAGADVRYRSVIIDNATPDDLVYAAEALLTREFAGTRVNTAAHTIVTEPLEYSTAKESGSARDLYGGRSRMRRTARFVADEQGDRTVARLRVEVERRDDGRRRASQSAAGRLGDAPAWTPIEEDAATTESQNAVWTRVRRDVGMEQRLLDELARMFAPEGP